MSQIAPPPRPLVVLIVDDDPAVRQFLVDYVTEMDNQALEATNGLEALWIVKHQRPDLVLVDLTLPRVGGYETIRHIQKFDPSIRVAVITGDGTEQTRRDVERRGLELLTKPFDLQALNALFGKAA